jgi:transcriptional antiterminator
LPPRGILLLLGQILHNHISVFGGGYTEFTISQVSSLTVPLAQQYARAVSEKTIQRDVEKLIELQLVRRSGGGYIANTDILRSMIAKRRSS